MNEEDHVKGYLFGLIMIPIIIFLTWLFVWPPVYAADTKVTDMTAETAPAAADIVYLIKSPGGAGTDRQATVGNLTKGLTIANFPASANVVSLLGAADYADFRTLLGVTTGTADNLIFGSDARGDMAVRGATVYGRVALGTEGKIWVAGATAPAWSAYTLAAPGAAGGLLQSNGTNWVRVTSLTGLTFGGFTASEAGMVPLTDASGNLVNSYLKFTGPASSMKTYTLPNANGTIVVSGGNIGAATGTSLVTTGLIDGLTHIETADGKTIDKLSAYYNVDGTTAFIVPTPAAAGGNQYCFKNKVNETNVITVVPVHTSGVMLQNTANTAYCTADDKLVSGGAATDKLCIVALDATHYETFSFTGTWTCTSH